MAFMVFFLSMVIDNFYIVWSIFFPHKTETGGVLGAYFVTMTIIAVPRLGTLAVMSIIIAGQLTTAALLDQYGMFGLRQIPLTPLRGVGIILLCIGASLVIRK
jgi:bacterial/archaeal transporter family-2 protein